MMPPKLWSSPLKRLPLQELTVEGFKSHFSRTRLAIRPLTVLAGANSSGKSSAVQAMLLIKQTLDLLPYDVGPLKLDGPNVTFRSTELFSGRPKDQRKVFSVGFGFSPDIGLETSFRRLTHGVELAGTIYSSGGDKVELQSGRNLPEGHRNAIGAAYTPGMPPSRWVSFLVPLLGAAHDSGVDSVPEVESLPAPVAHVANALRDMSHVAGSIGNPSRTYPRFAATGGSPGLFHARFAALLADWTTQDDPRLDKVVEALVDLGLTWKVKASTVDASSVEISVGRTSSPYRGGAYDLVNIADVGFGVSQALPAIVALVAATPGQLIYLEEPEIHLHPNAQRGMADLIADSARRGVRCIVETHSDVILTRLQWNIARNHEALKPGDSIFHWFTRDPKTGESKVTSVEPDRAGAYGDWPVDFGDVAAETSTEYIEAAHHQLVREKP